MDKEIKNIIINLRNKDFDTFELFMKLLDKIKKDIRKKIADTVLSKHFNEKDLTELKIEYKILNRICNEISIISNKEDKK